MNTAIDNISSSIYLSGTTMTIDAPLVLSGNNGNTQIDIINGGHLALAASTSGGGIAITAGTLEFAQEPSFMHYPETASEHFSSWLAFTGASATLQFDGVHGPLSVAFNPTLDDLTVSSRCGKVIGEFHFAASQQPYSAAEFSVKGNEVLYTHIAPAYP